MSIILNNVMWYYVTHVQSAEVREPLCIVKCWYVNNIFVEPGSQTQQFGLWYQGSEWYALCGNWHEN